MVAACTSWLIGVSLAIIANIISNLGLNFQKKAHSEREKSARQSITPTTEDIAVTEQLIPSKSNSKSPILLTTISSSDRDDRSNEGTLLSNLSTKSGSITVKNGKNILKNKNKYSELDTHQQQQSYVCDITWILGLFLQILGALLDFIALAYAPQSVVAPLGSLTLVVNVFLSPCMHSESPSFRTLISTLIIIIGAATTVVSSPKNNNISSIFDIFAIYTTISFVIYITTTSIFIITGLLLTSYFLRISFNHPKLYKSTYYKYHRFIIASISGTMGAHNILFAKSISLLIVKSIDKSSPEEDGNLFEYFETYLLIFGLIFTIYFQLKWLNDGLKRFSSLYVAPTFQAFWITVSVLGGLIVFDEFENMRKLHKIMFSFGVICTIGGVAYLTKQGKPKQLKKGDIKIQHYIPLLFCFLVLYFIYATIVHSKYSICV